MAFNIIDGFGFFMCRLLFDRLCIFLLGEAWAICPYFLFSVFASSGVAWIWRCTCALPSTLLSTLVACFRIHFSHLAAFAFA